jgi:hypothetical protein
MSLLQRIGLGIAGTILASSALSASGASLQDMVNGQPAAQTQQKSIISQFIEWSERYAIKNPSTQEVIGSGQGSEISVNSRIYNPDYVVRAVLTDGTVYAAFFDDGDFYFAVAERREGIVMDWSDGTFEARVSYLFVHKKDSSINYSRILGLSRPAAQGAEIYNAPVDIGTKEGRGAYETLVKHFDIFFREISENIE